MNYTILLTAIKTTWGKNLTLFLFCFAILFGPAYALFDSYDYDTIANPDLATYLGLANFDFDQSAVRKYRVIIPFLAASINYLFGWVFNLVTPNSFPSPDFSLCLSFLIVNCLFMSVFGVLVYHLCRAFGASLLGAIIGLLSVLTCRWASYIAGTPIVDSLYMLIVAMTLLGIKTKNPTLVILAVFIGPWAKESFIFIAPLLFFYSSIPKMKQLLLFTISALLVFSFRYYLDVQSHSTYSVGLKNDFDHINNISLSLTQLFSFHGLYELFSIVGIWGLLFIFLINKQVRTLLKQNTPAYMLLFLLIVLVHTLLSTQLARMFYIATPVIAIWLSLISDEVFFTKSLKHHDTSTVV